jgi:hypothetical protein
LLAGGAQRTAEVTQAPDNVRPSSIDRLSAWLA